MPIADGAAKVDQDMISLTVEQAGPIRPFFFWCVFGRIWGRGEAVRERMREKGKQVTVLKQEDVQGEKTYFACCKKISTFNGKNILACISHKP